MALTNLAITYDLQPAVVFPGKPISGKITFTVNEPIPFDHVRVECIGVANIKRTKTVTSSIGFNKNVTYSACEVCCEQSKTVLDGSTNSPSPSEDDDAGKMNGARSVTAIDQLDLDKPVSLAHKISTLKPASTSVIKPGPYTFPFNFYIPLKCPSSVEGSYGHVRYFCKVLVTCSGTVRFAYKEAFTVIGWTDLNLYPTAGFHYQTEGHATDEKGGKVLARLFLRQQGYVPGEVVNARMEIVNNSTKPLSVIFAQFIQRITYAAKRENAADWSKWDERNVLQQATRKEKVSASKSSIFKWEAFAVPPTCPTMVIDTNILRVHYEVQFQFVFDTSAPGLVVSAPVIIGAMPLKQSFDELRGVHLRQTDGNLHSGATLAMIEQYPELPLPLYKPQATDEVDIRDPSDLVYMPDPIKYQPLAVVYEPSASLDTADDNKKTIRRESTEKRESRASRSLSRLSRFSFRSSTENVNLATTPKAYTPETPKKVDDGKEKKKLEKEEKKRQQEEEKKQKEEEKKKVVTVVEEHKLKVEDKKQTDDVKKQKEEEKKQKEDEKRQKEEEKRQKEEEEKKQKEEEKKRKQQEKLTAKPRSSSTFRKWVTKKEESPKSEVKPVVLLPVGAASPVVVNHYLKLEPELTTGPIDQPRFLDKATQEPEVENGAVSGSSSSIGESL